MSQVEKTEQDNELAKRIYETWKKNTLAEEVQKVTSNEWLEPSGSLRGEVFQSTKILTQVSS